jgi:hypothetical protein
MVGSEQRLSGTLPVSELLNSLMYFSFAIDPNDDGILLVKLFESRYKYCNDDNDDNDDGMLPIRPHDDSITLANVPIALRLSGMDPCRRFPLKFNDVTLDNLPIELGIDPTKPAAATEIATTLPPEQLTPGHPDVLGPVHTLPVSGCDPVHCQPLNAAIVAADRAADKSHITLSCDMTTVGCIVGAPLLDTPHTGVLPNLPTVDVNFVKQLA